MNSVINDARKGVRFVLVSQILVLVLGVLKSLLVPVILGVNDFAYWQIYVFYIAYVGLFTLGFNDGIYLRYGGADYSLLHGAHIRSSIRLYFVYLVVMAGLMSLVSSAESDPNKRTVLYLACLNIVLMGLMAIFSFVLQATGRLRQFGIVNAIDKILFIVFLLGLVMVGTKSFTWFVLAELLAKMFALGFMCLSCRELIKGEGSDWRSAATEVRDNIACGIKLMFANLSGMLVLGIGRLVIEYWATLEDYAYYAFGVSMTNLALIALTSISVVIYPALKRLPPERYLHYYDDTNTKLFKFNLIMLAAYFPVVWFITYAIPKYAQVIPFLNLLFVVTTLQGKMQLLINNYYKALRYEGKMLRANIESLAVATVLSVILYFLNRSTWAIAAAAVLTMLYRVYMSERFLRRTMGGVGGASIMLELAAYCTFIAITTAFDYVYAFVVFCLLLGTYSYYARQEFQELFKFVMKGQSR